jgi:hypothetical protein
LYVTNAPGFVAKNNIFMTNGTTYIITVKGAINNFSNLNYNVYFNKGTTQASAYLDTYGGTHTLTQLRSRGAEEKGIYGNPQLDSEWIPADGSIVVDKGFNLSAPYNVDKIGTVRPFNVVSDMGAYEKKWGVLAPPAVPGSLTGNTLGTNKIGLLWNDGCNTEDGFRIERRKSGGEWSQVASVAKDVLTYEDSGLESSTTYNYRVRAYNTAGTSAYSNECTAATSSVTGTTVNVSMDLTTASYFYSAYNKIAGGSIAPKVWVLESKKSYVEYTFTVTLSGEYFIEGRFFHGSRGTGAFSVQLNGGSKYTASDNKLIGTWKWGNKISLGTLQPGGYTIRVSNSKPSSDSYIDILRVTGSSTSSQPVESGTEELNGVTTLANYPNPFNPQTTVIYKVPSEGRVTLKVYDILGNVVSVLADDHKISGTYEAIFNGSRLSSGVYFLELRTPEAVHVRKMNMLK